MPAVLLPNGKQQFFTTPGVPAVGYKLATFAAGTSTPQATWSDANKIGANTNPIILDARGEAVIFWDGAYKVQLQDATGAVIWTVDNVSSIQPLSASLIPTVDNSFSLGSNAFSWANVYAGTNVFVGANRIPVLDTATGNIGYTARTAGEITAGVTPTLYAYSPGDLRRYGADPTGVASSWSAFNKAVSVCKATGNTLIVPAGNFLIDTVNGTINLSYVTILGTGVTDGAANPAAAGSVLSITGTTVSPFTMGPGVTFDGVAFFYPAQVDTFTPIVFPPTIVTSLAIAGAINFCYIQNCTVFNAYRFFVNADTTGAIGHVFVDNNTIYGILTCFEISYNSEIITFTGNEFTFGHYLAATETGLRKFTRANGLALVFIKTDGFGFNSNVIYGYSVGLYFNTGTSATLCQLISITQNYFDAVVTGILASGNGCFAGNTITANSFLSYNPQNTAVLGTAISILTTGTFASELIAISANNFSTCSGNQIVTTGAAVRTLTITGNSFTAWGQFQTAGSYAALNITGSATSYIASGNTMVNQANTPAVATGIIGTPVDALITANFFVNCNAAINATFNAAVVTGNRSVGTISAASNTYAFFTNILDANNEWDKNAFKSPNQTPIAQYGNYANDAAAAAGGVLIGGQYRNASVVQVRVA